MEVLGSTPGKSAKLLQFEQRHPCGHEGTTGILPCLWTGVRRSDVVLLGKQHVRDGWFKFTQQKNPNRKPVTIEIPILPDLQRVIDASPTGDLNFLVSERKTPLAISAFGNWFQVRSDVSRATSVLGAWFAQGSGQHCRRRRRHRASAHGHIRVGNDGGGTL